ncbi:HK97-gp10 family putative phage morphogenesis protein [Bacillus safensis]|uniref:HK97-gp10 family putative phage morphogenesis protein n=1 Tax=Bacillus safensis TaxID=561879 RepID=UPI002FFED9C3
MGVNVNGMSALMRKIEQLGKMNDQVKSGAVNAGAEVIKKEMERRNPSSQHKIVSQQQRPDTVEIGPSYGFFTAHFFEFGTSRHLIEIKNRKIMSDGAKLYGKTIDHPGQRPQPFIEPSFIDKKDEAVKAMADYLRRYLT